MRIACVSDTHGALPRLQEVDLLIHAGDACSYGTMGELKRFIKWWQAAPARSKIYVPGNHDKVMERGRGQREVAALMGEGREVQGLKVWGSPVTPKFGRDWSFNMARGAVIREHWAQIPLDTDILVTHGPPYGHGDLVTGRRAGCLELMKRVAVVRPKLHVFGHIHEGYGITASDEVGTLFINASHMDGDYQPVNAVVYLELP